jgi:hypothetical protein
VRAFTARTRPRLVHRSIGSTFLDEGLDRDDCEAVLDVVVGLGLDDEGPR